MPVGKNVFFRKRHLANVRKGSSNFINFDKPKLETQHTLSSSTSNNQENNQNTTQEQKSSDADASSPESKDEPPDEELEEPASKRPSTIEVAVETPPCSPEIPTPKQSVHVDTPVEPKEPPIIPNSSKLSNFLVSFIADARGATVTSDRTLLSITVPPNAASRPTRFSCKPAKLTTSSQKFIKLPSILQHDATNLASQVLELSPPEESFLNYITIKIPHSASIGNDFQREVIAFLSMDGHNWSIYDDNEDLQKFKEDFFTLKLKTLPKYLAIITRPAHWASYVGKQGSLLKTGSKRCATADLTSELD